MLFNELIKKIPWKTYLKSPLNIQFKQFFNAGHYEFIR